MDQQHRVQRGFRQHGGVAGDASDGLASSAIHALLVQEIRKAGTGVDRRAFSSIPREAHVASIATQQLVEEAYRTYGAGLLLKAGQGIDKLGSHPCVILLTRARSVEELLRIWVALQEHFHGRYRLGLVSSEPGSILLEHVSTIPGEPPPIGNTLLVTGILVAAALRLGVQQLKVVASNHEGELRVLYAGHRFAEGHIGLDHTKRIRHVMFLWEPVALASARPNASDGAHDAEADPDLDALWLLARIDREVAECIGASPSIAQIARRVGVSVRNMQRVLNENGLRFADLVRSHRLRRAGQQLACDSQSLVEIALDCGFYDSAHFSREFSTSVGMPPSVFRRIATA